MLQKLNFLFVPNFVIKKIDLQFVLKFNRLSCGHQYSELGLGLRFKGQLQVFRLVMSLVHFPTLQRLE